MNHQRHPKKAHSSTLVKKHWTDDVWLFIPCQGQSGWGPVHRHRCNSLRCSFCSWSGETRKLWGTTHDKTYYVQHVNKLSGKKNFVIWEIKLYLKQKGSKSCHTNYKLSLLYLVVDQRKAPQAQAKWSHQHALWLWLWCTAERSDFCPAPPVRNQC